ncbi:TRAP dicarboxylate transporter subunit DctP [Ichthyobacterium seriolicida]|uniref:TRAP dicarboxylate transporter subunit DctP n=2 Tax=Ichthyobacterium seriolicida TaxID=242600 RepID=A0A1J1E9X4_9FLAO|nr:TRAP dicarboxylate transporter subunit DctP [Ichthyobacterium seriolicida]
MTTTWLPNFPILGESANKYSEIVEELSNGQMKIKVYGGGELTPSLGAFDAVSNGSIEMASSAPYYWSGKVPCGSFFSSVPFGMNAQQMTSWLVSGGGYELWKEAYSKYNLIPFMAGHSGTQMGGWFNKEIKSVKDLNGLKMRIPGIGGKVLNEVGGAAMLTAVGEIYTNLERNVIDATEWIGPYHDYKVGFNKIAKYYYFPGWHEPNTAFEFIVNKQKYEALPKHLQAILEVASSKVAIWVIAEFEKQNSVFIKKMKDEGVTIREFPKEVLDELREKTKTVLNKMISDDEVSKKVYKSYSEFQNMTDEWSEMSEKAFYTKIKK